MTENDKKSKLSKRFAVTTISPEKTMLGKITIELLDDKSVSFSITGDKNENVEKIESILRKLKPKSSSDDETDNLESFDKAIIQISTAMENDGLSLHELPEGDFQFRLEYDLKNNRTLGEQKPLHSFTDAPDDLAQKIHASLAGVLDRFADNLSDKIISALEENDPDKAIAAIKTAREAGEFNFFPTPQLLEALTQLNIDDLTKDDAVLMTEVCLTTAHRLKRFDIAGQNAEQLLILDEDNLDESKKAGLNMVIALAAKDKGYTETALAIWRDLLSRPGELGAGNRGWAWRNIALTLGPKDSEAMAAARYSADAFLEEGDKREAVASLSILKD
jgi:hypothetical protein